MVALRGSVLFQEGQYLGFKRSYAHLRVAYSKWVLIWGTVEI